jgi:hypothetical protein
MRDVFRVFGCFHVQRLWLAPSGQNAVLVTHFEGSFANFNQHRLLEIRLKILEHNQIRRKTNNHADDEERKKEKKKKKKKKKKPVHFEKYLNKICSP